MIRGRLFQVFGVAALCVGSPAAAAADPAKYMPAQLVAETLQPRPGSTILLGFKLAPKAGWHGYWSNPGDSGLVPTASWSAPAGVTIGPLLHPAPTLISDSGIDSFVHDGPHILLARMKVPASVSRGTAIPIKATLNWAACTATQCVPLSATFTLNLTAGSGTKSPDWIALQSAQRKLPRSAGKGTFTIDGRMVELRLPPEARLDARRTLFFPDDNESFETAGGRAAKVESGISVTGPTNSKTLSALSGVATDGRTAYRVFFVKGAADGAPERRQDKLAKGTDETGSGQPAMTDGPAQAGPALNQQAERPGEKPKKAAFPWFALAGGALGTAGLAALALARRTRR